jgi:hypothetical protein
MANEIGAAHDVVHRERKGGGAGAGLRGKRRASGEDGNGKDGLNMRPLKPENAYW